MMVTKSTSSHAGDSYPQNNVSTVSSNSMLTVKKNSCTPEKFIKINLCYVFFVTMETFTYAQICILSKEVDL